MSDYAKDVLVETDWVAEHLDDDSIRIVEVDENPALYAEAHIPGAIGFDWKADLQDQVKRDFLEPGGVRRADGQPRDLQRPHGRPLRRPQQLVRRLHLLVLPLLRPRQGQADQRPAREVDRRGPRDDRPRCRRIQPASFEAKPGDDAIRARRDEVREALDSETNLVDVRSPQEYSGELIAMAGYEQEGAQRAGHIPGAASVPWAQAVNEDGTFKSRRRAARALHRCQGVIEDGKPVIAYCRIGERSAHTWFVLHELLGEDDVKNYDGSWTEWGNLVDVPIEKDV